MVVMVRKFGSAEKHEGKGFHKRRLFTVNVCGKDCKRLRERLQTFAGKEAMHCLFRLSRKYIGEVIPLKSRYSLTHIT